jgi:multidrug efflux pump subunit AcrA (membrane-fusion protein)
MTSKWIVVAGVNLLLVLSGCNRHEETNEESATSSARVPVKISQLNKSNIESVVSAIGRTDALRKEKIFSPISGRVITLKVLEGSSVHTGDIILTIRTKETQAAIEGAEALMRIASTTEEKLKAQRALVLADSLQPHISIKAPFDGLIASRNVTEGELVGEQTELLTIIDPATIVFIADVSINSIAAIHPDLPARIKFPQLQTDLIDAVVEAINPQADAQSQSVKIRIRFQNLSVKQRYLIKSNITGTCYIITGSHKDVFAVNRSVLLHDDETNAYSLIAMTNDSLAKIIPVTVGIQTDSLVEISSDILHAGMTIITIGHYALTDSTRVTIEQ